MEVFMAMAKKKTMGTKSSMARKTATKKTSARGATKSKSR
jgi:hypothetical protein